MTVLTLFGALASAVFTPLATWLEQLQGWRDALVTLAAIVAVLAALPHALFLRKAPAAGGAGNPTRPVPGAPASTSAAHAVRGATFWLLTTAVVISSFVTMAINVHLFAYLREEGFAASFVALAVGVIGAVQVPARALLLPLGRLLSRPALAALVFSLQGVGLLVLLAAVGPGLVLVAVVSFGLGKGMVTLLRASLLAEFYGAANYGTIGGVVAFFIAGSQAVAPLSVGYLYDRLGGYDAIIAMLAAAGALAAASGALAERFGPRVRTA